MTWIQHLQELATRMGWGELAFDEDSRSGLQVGGLGLVRIALNENGDRMHLRSQVGTLPESVAGSHKAGAALLQGSLFGMHASGGSFSLGDDGRSCFLNRIFWLHEAEPSDQFERMVGEFLDSTERWAAALTKGSLAPEGDEQRL